MKQLVNSMTGFGQAQGKIDQTTISIEVKTVNHRFLDFSFKMPREFLGFEDAMKQKIRQYFNRGRIDVFINISGEGVRSKDIQVNWKTLDQYLKALEEIKEKRDISSDIEFEDLLQLEGIFIEEENAEVDGEVQDKIIELLEEVLQKVNAMRQDEGAALKVEVLNRINNVKDYTNELEQHIDTIQKEYQERIKERIHSHLNDTAQDESRIIQEVAILTDKSDITEEITRLFSHVAQVQEAVNLHQPIGRKLDFITQELLRETNTIGSKSNDVRISKIVVALKSEIEKIKEQVQNIE
ncbi:YicC family protein [Filobacillus milosensis]|uniref:YicC family protein n=1 Tax=Filobacillus milosensis TaxID=94137 RepID=A0A4Y8INZ7_9BACI|nr:YicC/YloC family endoribonuclease [Filobacillus milosensis]TFB23265.1 YicC family protein [Filobacillus milosensis]